MTGIAVGLPGYAGWRVLNRTMAAQQAVVARDPVLNRDHDYFREKMKTIASAEEFVADYRLMKLSLTSAGLEGDLQSRFFIRKVLESDLSDPKSFANRLTDKRYAAFAKSITAAMGSRGGAAIENVIGNHRQAELEARVGAVDPDLRVALYARREIATIASASSTENTKWYQILGSSPLRKVVGGALGIGTSYAKLPLDRQLDEFRNAAGKLFGTSDAKAIAEPANMEKLIQRFLIRSQATQGTTSNYSAALQLLR